MSDQSRLARRATVERVTSESTVRVHVDLDGTGASTVATGVGFYDHMLTALARHALLDLEVSATGDTYLDAHHTVEDVAIVLGQALRLALGDKTGIRRFGDALVPLDEALAQAVVDVSGRPYCVCTGEPEGQAYVRIGGGERTPDGRSSVPLVLGTPWTRGSKATAARRARASALNCASTRWCGSRPASTRTCSAMPAVTASVSNTCRVREPT